MASRNISGTIIFSLGIMLFFASAVFGMPYFGMAMQKDGSMGSCPFVMGAVCTMTLFEHLALWQNMAGALPSGQILLFPLFLACAYYIAQIWRGRPLLRADGPNIKTRFIARNFLQHAFSNGILHPKLFS